LLLLELEKELVFELTGESESDAEPDLVLLILSEGDSRSPSVDPSRLGMPI
jgi:hypothetical protein